MPPARSQPKAAGLKAFKISGEAHEADPAHADIYNRRKPFRTGDPAGFDEDADSGD